MNCKLSLSKISVFTNTKKAVKIMGISQKEYLLANLRRAIDKIANVSVVFGDSDTVVTALHETRRVRKTQYKS